MSAPAIAVTVKAPASPASPDTPNLLLSQTKAATSPAADGLGRPTKNRLSALDACELKRASRSAAATANRSATSRPTRPHGGFPPAGRAAPRWYTAIGGATADDPV